MPTASCYGPWRADTRPPRRHRIAEAPRRRAVMGPLVDREAAPAQVPLAQAKYRSRDLCRPGSAASVIEQAPYAPAGSPEARGLIRRPGGADLVNGGATTGRHGSAERSQNFERSGPMTARRRGASATLCRRGSAVKQQTYGGASSRWLSDPMAARHRGGSVRRHRRPAVKPQLGVRLGREPVLDFPDRRNTRLQLGAGEALREIKIVAEVARF